MKKYTSTIIIAIIIIAVFFVIKNNQDDGEKVSLYPINDEIEKDTEKFKEAINENKIINNEELEKEEKKEVATINNFIQCLADAGVVIYGSKTCPACASLINSLGGYETVESIYVECSKEGDRCSSEMQTNYVPEIQILGQLYNGPRSPNSIAEAVNCKI